MRVQTNASFLERRERLSQKRPKLFLREEKKHSHTKKDKKKIKLTTKKKKEREKKDGAATTSTVERQLPQTRTILWAFI